LDKPAYDVRTMLACLPVVQEIVEAMNGLGWDVFSFDQEDAPGQFETDFKYADALTMADRFTFFRLMAHEIARKHGLFASFMPKPYGHRTGSGAHYNMSLAATRRTRAAADCRRSATSSSPGCCATPRRSRPSSLPP
jgi:glutamine synthetase